MELSVRVPERVSWAVEQLAPSPTDRMLEIGCGPGHAVALLCNTLTSGTITAIDRSALQVKKTCARSQACIAAGRARALKLTLDEAPDALGESWFSKVFAINVNAFWTEPEASFGSLSRLLRRDGVAYLFYEPPSMDRLRELSSRLPELFRAHGLLVEGTRTRAFAKGHGLCVMGRAAIAS